MKKIVQSAFLIVAAMLASALLIAAALSAVTSVSLLEDVQDLFCGIVVLENPTPPNHLLDRTVLAALFGESDTITLGTDPQSVTFLRPSDDSSVLEAPTNIARLSGAVLILSYANASASLHSLQSALSQKDALVVEGVLRNSVSRLGKSVSFDHDILPLMTKAGTLQILRRDTGLEVVLEGSMEEGTRLNAILDRMHHSFMLTLPSLKVTARVLDRRFSSTDIRHDTSMIETDQYAEGNWAVQYTKHVEQRNGLFTATQGSRFLISTSEALLNQAMTNRTTLTLPRSEERGTLLGGGQVDMQNIHLLLKGLSPLLSEFFGKNHTGIVQFSSLVHDEKKRLTIHSENTDILLDYFLRNY